LAVFGGEAADEVLARLDEEALAHGEPGGERLLLEELQDLARDVAEGRGPEVELLQDGDGLGEPLLVGDGREREEVAEHVHEGQQRRLGHLGVHLHLLRQRQHLGHQRLQHRLELGLVLGDALQAGVQGGAVAAAGLVDVQRREVHDVLQLLVLVRLEDSEKKTEGDDHNNSNNGRTRQKY